MNLFFLYVQLLGKYTSPMDPMEKTTSSTFPETNSWALKIDGWKAIRLPFGQAPSFQVRM